MPEIRIQIKGFIFTIKSDKNKKQHPHHDALVVEFVHFLDRKWCNKVTVRTSVSKSASLRTIVNNCVVFSGTYGCEFICVCE